MRSFSGRWRCPRPGCRDGLRPALPAGPIPTGRSAYLKRLSLRYDIVLAMGDCGLPLNSFRLHSAAAHLPPEAAGGTIRIADPAAGVAACAEILFAWLQ